MLAFVLGEIIAVVKAERIVFLFIFCALIIIKIITKKQAGVFVVIFLFIFLGFCMCSYKIMQRDMVWSMKEGSSIIMGTTEKIRKTEYGYNLFLNNAIIRGKNCGGVIVYFEEEPDIKVGNSVEIKGAVKQFNIAHNEGDFDSKRYYLSLGIFAKINAEDYKVTNKKYDYLRERLYELREKINKNFTKICDIDSKSVISMIYKNKAGVFSAITTGDKSELDDNIKELYSMSGISHILAISGLHISIIGMFVYGLLRKRLSFGVSSFFAIGIITLFGIISDMGIATIRAFIMFVLKIIGEVLGQKYDYITAMSLAGIMMLIYNPFIIINSAFQMSFCAITAITIVWPNLCCILNLSSKMTKSIVFSLCISIVMNPVIAYNYYQLPTYSFILNVVVVPLMSVVVVSSVAGSVVTLFSSAAGYVAVIPGCVVIEVYDVMCKLVSKLPLSVITVGKPGAVNIMFYYLILAVSVILLVLIRKKAEKHIKVEEKNIGKNGKQLIGIPMELKQQKAVNLKLRITVIVIYMMMSCLIYIKPHDGLSIKFMDVGQGDGIFIRTDNGTTLTIDGGSTSVSKVGKNRIVSCIKADGTGCIDYAVVTHVDEDHINGLVEMLSMSGDGSFKIKNLVMPDIYLKDNAYNDLIKAAVENKVNVLYISKGDVLRLGGVEIECIHPGNNYISDDRNDYSTVLSLKYGRFSALFTGDISSGQETKLIKCSDKKYTVLKIPHHGSKYSTSEEFLSHVNPDYSIVSVGENNLYGHPHCELIKRLKKSGSNVIRTDKSGGITVQSDGEKMVIEKSIE